MGCHYSPEDFKDLTFDGLKKEIDRGHISIDWWDGNPFEESYEPSEIYFLRIRNVNASIVDPSWGGRCILLKDHGCPLSYKNRPKGGKLLIPSEDFRCKQEYTKHQCAQDWYKYIDVLRELKEFYNDEGDRLKKLIEECLSRA